MVFRSKPEAAHIRPGGRECVLLTGAHGFTGRYVRASLVAAGYQVVDATNEPASHSRLDEVVLDITSAEDCRSAMRNVKPDYLVHLAAISFVQHANPLDFYRVNVIGTLNLLQALADTGLTLKKVLIASSANVYGNTSAGVLSEAQAPAPVNHYAMSKLAMEYMVRQWTDRQPIVITRPFNYTGVGQAEQFLVPKIVSHFRRGAGEIELGNLDVERDFSDVRMVANIYRDLLAADCAGEVVNVCSGRAYSLRAIVAICESLSGHKTCLRVNPAFVRANEVRTLSGSTEKLRRLLPNIDNIELPLTLQWMLEA